MEYIFAGIDSGSSTTKAVIYGEGQIRSHAIAPTGHRVSESAERVLATALKTAGVDENSLGYIITTGYGRRCISIGNRSIPEIICHAKGAFYLSKDIGGVIDIGGQDSKVICLDENGEVVDFTMNDKCAAGTGRFLEVMANVMELNLEDLGPVSLKSQSPCKISNTCTIFAESEVIALRAEGRIREDLVAGIHEAVASRIAIMAAAYSLSGKAMFTGGVAKNSGIKKILEKNLNVQLIIPFEPQIIGALGAAILASQETVRYSGR
jgi:(R)-2-hydroxyacyl-CoA dehydratese activating ATPase